MLAKVVNDDAMNLMPRFFRWQASSYKGFSSKSKKRRNDGDDHYQANDVDDAVHEYYLSMASKQAKAFASLWISTTGRPAPFHHEVPKPLDRSAAEAVWVSGVGELACAVCSVVLVTVSRTASYPSRACCLTLSARPALVRPI